MLDPALLEAIAEDMGLMKKKRVHHAGLIVCAVMLSAFQGPTDTQGRWLDAQRTYEAIGGPRASRESFDKQVVKLAPLLRALVQRRFDDMTARASRNHLRGRLAHFADVLIPDGCGFKLAKALSGVYAGTGVPAQMKLTGSGTSAPRHGCHVASWNCGMTSAMPATMAGLDFAWNSPTP